MDRISFLIEAQLHQPWLNNVEGWEVDYDQIVHLPQRNIFKNDIEDIMFVVQKAVIDESRRHIDVLNSLGSKEKTFVEHVAKVDLNLNIKFDDEYGLIQITDDGYKNYLSTSRVPC